MRRYITIVMMILLSTIVAQGQIRIGGNVYGGGNQGEVKGSTKVTVKGGDIGAAIDPETVRPLAHPKGKVFGGARMANVGGNSFVCIDGEHATDYIVINQVFGGNDMSGTIGTGVLPTELSGNADGVNATWNTFVHLSSKVDGTGKAATDAKKVYIGQLYAGSNGDYYYTSTTEGGKTTHYLYTKEGGELVESLVTDEGEIGFYQPEVAKSYLDVQGGSIVYAYGGGNNVTVTEKTVIHVDNPSEVVNHILVDSTTGEEADDETYVTYETDETKTIPTGYADLLSETRFKEMGINTAPIVGANPSSDEFQIGRFFGGNNRAEMAIMPTWNLQSGKIRNLYSGGNRGKMTSPAGLLVEIPATSTIIIDNLYGGCRMADVMPTVDGSYSPCLNLTRANYPGLGLTKDYAFPNELSARVIVDGGDVNNVFGGNDITGVVYGGNAVGIRHSIRGDIYGGGNGAYPYTDLINEESEDYEAYGEYKYDVTGSSTEALNAFRPNAEQVSIRLVGTEAAPTLIRGSVFLGGNCATLATKKRNPLVELKIGSYVIADKVFLGNNGEMMVNEDILGKYAESNFSTLQLTTAQTFNNYMEGVCMTLQPTIKFESTGDGDPADYIDNTSYIGSFYCGGNVGSMAIPGKNVYKIDRKLNIFEKFVGGCNKANVPVAPGLNAAYEGGVLGTASERPEYLDESGKIKDRLQIDMENLAIVPMRWNTGKTGLEWNTQKWNVPEDSEEEPGFVEVTKNADDRDIRVLGGNVYGGCYESGHVNGNVVININEDALQRDAVFGSENSGVELLDQRDDVLAVALSVFGGGYGEDTEIWGSATVNHNSGYVFQIFGGGELGVVGKKNNAGQYTYDERYSTIVNLNGTVAASDAVTDVEDLAETEYIYGGGNEGDVCGNTLVNLGNGRIYDAFGGASDAEILGHTEVYIGRQPNGATGTYKDGFPWIRDIVYGGNDFGGTIHGNYEDSYNFEDRLRNYDTDKTQIHGYKEGELPEVLKSSSYVEYLMGRVDTIFGGGYGFYDYKDKTLYDEGSKMPEQESAFVNIRPKSHTNNFIKSVFGGGTGYPGNRNDDRAQNRSYVLVDIPDGVTNFSHVEVFGSGSYNGLGMGVDKTALANGSMPLDKASAIIDLLSGRIHNVYGGSFNEGITRRTVVNVPAASSIQIDSIFGGAYGVQILPPCDVYETQVNYRNSSENAQVFGAIFGGNNNERRSLYTQVNISSPVYSNKEKGYTGRVYGAGRGIDTWSEYTEVNLLDGARVYNVYGGGEMGHVLNTESTQKYMQLYINEPSSQIGSQDPYWKTHLSDLTSENSATQTQAQKRWADDWKEAWTFGDYFIPNADYSNYIDNATTNLSRISNRAELDDKTAALLAGKKYNTNVIINPGAIVEGYAYGGGLGRAGVDLSGDVYGTTYVAVLGGEVKKDVYAAGHAGGMDDLFSAGFTATTNAYIQGGMVRNVYGGGYEGHVGHHVGAITASYADDRLAESHVVVGKAGVNSFTGGSPAITRNVYGGGEGGSVYGSSHVTINNGYVGYRYKNIGTAESPQYRYIMELDDQHPGDLDLSGNVFGGGYVINSYVDNTNINLFGGTIRGSVYGGGEIGPIGRGTMKEDATGGIQNGDARIYRAGTTCVNIFDGHVLRNVFGGGRGKDSWGGDGTLYMDPALVATLDMKSKGYIFGQTRVNIYGGEIGTNEGMLKGYGNVFGGCDEGSVYGAYMDGNNLCIGKKRGQRYDDGFEGYYFKYDGTNFLTTEETTNTYMLTEDCKVLVEPHCQANAAMLIGDNSYSIGDYVPTSVLNKLQNKTNSAAWWNNLDSRGIIIHNAVFAGGNIAAGSSSLFANTKTVFGNATASINDIYNRDLITIGTGHTGGLYGDGNLTFVDGYRELNITNYGTDYYHISKQLTYDEYKELPEREQAYYELKYKCLVECTDVEGTTYAADSNLPMDELLALFTDRDGSIIQKDGKYIIIEVNGKKVPNPVFWQENGVVSIYAGRIMNTIQRADFCGVFGSRMVMKGAQDRVPELADYTNYTINRVREVSLNKKDSEAGDTGDNATHGNYFGIYSVVNYLGALTSDVTFGAVRKTNRTETELAGDGTTTYYQWKEAHKTDKTRNNGTCHNHLALASGVYLELTTEKSTGNNLDEKDWGPITGIVELDLINVQPGIGGGFVYAKNVHGNPGPSGITTTTLTDLNLHAASKWDYAYTDETDGEDDSKINTQKEWQTSGNFIHSSQTIIDDCYNVSGRYKLGENPVPAHYWFISGSVYVYDQYISAYTGSPNAYSETVEVPITINAGSNGTMTLMDVQPNLYAFYSSYVDPTNNTPLTGDQKLVINDVTYQLNSPISYWDWNKLPVSQKNLFVRDTYVLMDSCYISNTYYPAGHVLLSSEYTSLKALATNHEIDGVSVKAVQKATVDGNGEPAIEKDDDSNPIYTAFDDAFRSSNNLSHTTGYLLTYNVTNPDIWNKWYTKVINETTGTVVSDQTGGTGYEDGPTYHPTTTGLYGQQQYDVNAIISQGEYHKYNGYDANADDDYTDAGDVYGLKQMYSAVADRTDQAEFVPAHLVTKEYASDNQHYYPGAPVSAEITGYTAPAFVSTATIQLSPTEYIYVNDLMTEEQKNAYYDRFKAGGAEANEQIAQDINDLIVPAYYCTKKGLYGGSYYETDKNYRAMEAYSSMSPADRQHFAFNYDALDLLIDPTYGGYNGKKYQYDGMHYDHTVTDADKDNMIYSLPRPIDYTATYNNDTDLTLTTDITVKRGGVETHNVKTVMKGDELLNTAYESLPNEQRHYAPIKVDKAGGNYYVVKESFVHGETPYAVGTTISEDTYNHLSNDQKYINVLTFPATTDDVTYYYCRERYQIGEKGEGLTPAIATGITGTIGGIAQNWVEVGTIINANTDGTNYGYASLANKQLGFIIHGVSPMETSTLYVARNADIHDLSTEKIITVVYKYDYEESDADGTHITPISERHVVNIHITFKSGVPTVDDINPPSIVLPGTGITMRIPTVTPGAYEITGGGWELFEKPSDAESHVNGKPYIPNVDPLYWYQDGYYLAYYAKTYLGKTYSNHVPVSVANYHDLKKVMSDANKTHHMYIDNKHVKREPKIYINDYSGSSKDGLDLLKDLYDLSLVTASSSAVTDGYTVAGGKITAATGTANTSLVGHALLDNQVRAERNLEFFLRTDINHNGSWTPIGDDGTCDDPSTENVDEGVTGKCFDGVFHGDGHTISGLDHSLFNYLCGEVYNLGVKGSFTGAGIAEQGGGYVESCWINTTGTPDGSGRAVFGNPSATSDIKQIVNSYYQIGKGYSTTDDDHHGLAKAMTDCAFYNGEVAYDLNNFYLYKRYSDKQVSSGMEYKYWKQGETDPQTGFYANHADLCSSGYNNIKYVENRFADGDYRYAGGEIPSSVDVRHWTEVRTGEDGQITLIDHYYPIWPDDYIFFGQKLTYGWAAQTHQDVPTAVVRNSGRLSDGSDANRVYRAPAYYGSKVMGVAHFNPDVYLATKSADGSKQAYPGMTAIDFAGHHDVFDNNGSSVTYKPYELGLQNGWFYAPLLDDDGLTSILNCDETQNLLVYAPSAADNVKTHGVLDSYFTEPVYNEHYDNSSHYRLVAEAAILNVHGHLVQRDLKATGDHLLVDKQDFNAPLAYAFDDDHLMWYQRTPSNKEYVDRAKGWQGISVPFTAELVTTSQKGEITHFYSGSDESLNSTGSKKGHEYWLRQFNSITEDNTDPENIIAKGTFDYPTAKGGSKTVTNHFLWDYYYKNTSVHNQKDYNGDTYLQYMQYYQEDRTYESYPLLTAATPYILGLPGSTYYEFDLSGNFMAQNTAVTIDKLNKQIITLASDKGEHIGVSDDELAGKTITYNGTDYTFIPSYKNQTLTASSDSYVLNADGDSYDKVGGDAKIVSAFRPYFTAVAASAGARRNMPRGIVFGGTNGDDFKDGPESALDGGLEVYTRGRILVTKSHMKQPTAIRITNVAGITLADFVLQPGETIETPIALAGVYIVNRNKLFIK